MDSKLQRAIIAALVADILSIALSAYAWARAVKLSLPLPKALPILAIFFSVISAPIAIFSGRIQRRLPRSPDLIAAFAYLSTVFPIVLLVLSFVYGVPTPLLSCSLENQWSHLFRVKNDQAIRAIQDRLRCCGFNSMRDRAWPFPASGIDAGECERTQGYRERCLGPWRREETSAAIMSGLANLGNWALAVLIIYIIRTRPQWFQRPQSLLPNGDPARRLISGSTDGEANGHMASEQRYSDNAPASEEVEH